MSNFQIDVSGSKGADAQHGGSYSSAAGTGQSGRRGMDAGPAVEGQNAGSVNMVLKSTSPTPPQTTIEISGTFVLPSGQQNALDKSHNLGDAGLIQIRANGGNGGRGGNGGDGEDGGRGHRGRDATDTLSGTDGGPGGNGGDGGNASHGAAGGAGGNVQVTVVDLDAQLFMLLDSISVNGAPGGSKGIAGSGGRGGAGGPGGDSYRWTTTRTEFKSTRSTDNYGRGYYTNKPYTVTDRHRNAGGSNGRNGNNGCNGNPASNGPNGHMGTCLYIVIENGFPQTYHERYNVNMEMFQIVAVDDDGVIEPGEMMHVTGVSIRNTGGMPTPGYQDVLLFLHCSKWIQPHSEMVPITRSIPPGACGTAQLPVQFAIGPHQPGLKDNPLCVQDAVCVQAMMGGVNRTFPPFALTQPIAVSYPIQASKICCIGSMLPGESSRIFWQIANISTRDYGHATTSARGIRVSLRLTGQVSGQLVHLKTPEGWHELSEEYSYFIPDLKAKTQNNFDEEITIAPSVEPYLEIILTLTLQFGDIKDHATLKEIQYRQFSIRIAESYKKTLDSEVLLVVNHSTTKAEVDTWRAVCTQIGTPMDIWDLSFIGHFDMEREDQSTHTDLFEDFHSKTIILLNYPFDNMAIDKTTAQSHALQYVVKEHFLRAIRRYAIRFLILGNVTKDSVNLLVPTHNMDNTEEQPFASGSKFLSFAKKEQNLATVCSEKNTLFTISVPKSIFCCGTDETKFIKTSRKIVKNLRNLSPEKRYIVSYSDATIDQKRFIGTIRVSQSIDFCSMGFLAVNIAVAACHDPNYILSDANFTLVVKSLSFEFKLNKMQQLLTGSDATAMEQVQTLLSVFQRVILFEMAAEYRHAFSSELTQLPDNMLPRILRFCMLTAPNTSFLHTSGGGKSFYDMVVTMIAFVQCQKSISDRLFPFRKRAKLAEFVLLRLRSMLTAVFPDNPPLLVKEIKKAMEAQVKQWDRASNGGKASDPFSKKAMHAFSEIDIKIEAGHFTDLLHFIDKSDCILNDGEYYSYLFEDEAKMRLLRQNEANNVANYKILGVETPQAQVVALKTQAIALQAQAVAPQAEDVSSQAEDVSSQAEDVSSQAEDVSSQAEDVSSQAEDVAPQAEVDPQREKSLSQNLTPVGE